MILGKKGQEAERIEIKMTSMIDMVFLLLIFFIVTLQYPREEGMIETRLPSAESVGEVTTPDERPEEFEDIILRITKGPAGNVRKYVQGTHMLNDMVLLGRLEALRTLHENGRVVIQCQDDVPYEELVNAISLVQIARLKIAFADLK